MATRTPGTTRRTPVQTVALIFSAVFLLVIFAVSVWNGGGFYIEVFGRK